MLGRSGSRGQHASGPLAAPTGCPSSSPAWRLLGHTLGGRHGGPRERARTLYAMGLWNSMYHDSLYMLRGAGRGRRIGAGRLAASSAGQCAWARQGPCRRCSCRRCSRAAGHPQAVILQRPGVLWHDEQQHHHYKVDADGGQRKVEVVIDLLLGEGVERAEEAAQQRRLLRPALHALALLGLGNEPALGASGAQRNCGMCAPGVA